VREDQWRGRSLRERRVGVAGYRDYRDADRFEMIDDGIQLVSFPGLRDQDRAVEGG
jgi:hypothetical protein